MVWRERGNPMNKGNEMEKFTPGPWWTYKNSAGSWVVATRRDDWPEDTKPQHGGAAICIGCGDHTELRTSGDAYQANAHLIAASPDLYEACEAALSMARMDYFNRAADFGIDLPTIQN